MTNAPQSIHVEKLSNTVYVSGREQTRQILCGMIVFGLMAFLYQNRLLLFASMSMSIMILAGIIELASCLILKFPSGAFKPELPRKEYLIDKRRKILVRIELMRYVTGWLLIPIALGLLLRNVVLARSNYETLLVSIVVLFVSVTAFFNGRRRIRRDLLPILEDIEMELPELKILPV